MTETYRLKPMPEPRIAYLRFVSANTTRLLSTPAFCQNNIAASSISDKCTLYQNEHQVRTDREKKQKIHRQIRPKNPLNKSIINPKTAHINIGRTQTTVK